MPPSPLSWIDAELARLEADGLLRRLRTRRGPQGAQAEVDGRPLVNFGSNDYLGLAAHPRLAEAVRGSVAASGWGAGASPLVLGRGSWHAELERRLAEFEGTEAALLFPSGFAANAGTVAALVGPGDAILSDAKNHASLIDGCRLSGAEVCVYPHADVAAAAERLAACRGRRNLIVTDSLFSMDGDLAPLPALAELAERQGAMLLIDEAHATGVFGAAGRGVAEHLGAADGVHVKVGTLSKALGSAGGFVAGSRRLIEWLLNRARPYVFSTASPEPLAAAAVAALDLVREEPQRRRELLAAAEELRGALREQGWRVGGASQIVPVVVGEPRRAMELAARLAERGLFVPGIRPPAVPEGESLLRISLSWAHTAEQRGELVQALADHAR